MPDDVGCGFGVAAALQFDRPHSARVYDFFLGGRDNYGPDRDAALQVLKVWPSVFVAVRENRAFMHRATRTLAEAGLDQWLDVGTGLPTEPNLHQVAQRVRPHARVVYVDNDPLVLAHAQALLTSTPEGRTAYADADVTTPVSILEHAMVTGTLDLTRPVALSLCALLHFVPDECDPHGIVTTLMRPLPSGSALVLSHVTADEDPATLEAVARIYRESGMTACPRSHAEVERFFDGLRLLDPGLVMAHRWRPDPVRAQLARIAGPTTTDIEISCWAGVAIKP